MSHSNPFPGPNGPNLGASLDEIFRRPLRTAGMLRPREKPTPEAEVAESEPQVQEEAAPASKPRITLSNLRWSATAAHFNDKAILQADAALPPELAHLTRLEFMMEAILPDGRKEFVSRHEGHLKDGTAAAEAILFWPQYREEDGTLLEKCEFVFTAKHRESDSAESPSLPVSVAPAILGQIWVQLLSPNAIPIAGAECKLLGRGRSFPTQKTDKNGRVLWTAVPFEDYKIELRLGSKTVLQPVPWLLDDHEVHIQKIRRTQQLLDSPWSVAGIQARLNALGFDSGMVDGILGPKTKAAIQSFQADSGLDPSGEMSPALQDLLQFKVGA